ncbi:MAG: alpha/beta hydrolase [Pseudomonadota bacterium]
MLQIFVVGLLMALVATGSALTQTEAALPTTKAPCATVATVHTRSNSATRYSWVPGRPVEGASSGGSVAFILLIGGGGTLDLDDAGCPRRLKGNILVRTAPLLQAAGIATALVDAPSDWSSGEGLAGFRMQPEHAADLARVIADVRTRSGATAVWVMGHSRGSLSAANAAARLSGAHAPDGVVLVSAMLQGETSKRKPWVSQTIFATELKAFKGALLLVGHAADNCERSLPERLDAAVQGSQAARQQVVRMVGGPRSTGRAPSLSTCEVHEAHDFVDQDAEFAQGVLRFVGGGRF